MLSFVLSLESVLEIKKHFKKIRGGNCNQGCESQQAAAVLLNMMSKYSRLTSLLQVSLLGIQQRGVNEAKCAETRGPI